MQSQTNVIPDPHFSALLRTIVLSFLANIRGFKREVFGNPGSPDYYLARMSAHVAAYLRQFDVKPNGPDLLKYILAFGISLLRYTSAQGDRHLVKRIVRLQTIHFLRATAALSRADQAPPPEVMYRKIQRIWNEERHAGCLGDFGTYMVFKTWSLG